MNIYFIISLPILFLIGIIIGYFTRKYIGKRQYNSAEIKALSIIENAKRDAENIKKEALLESKDKILKDRSYFEKEMRERRSEVSALEKRLNQKEENIERRLNLLEKKEYETEKEKKIATKKTMEAEKILTEYQKKIEKVARMTREEAKKLLLESMEKKAKLEAAGYINKIEAEAKRTAEKKAHEIIISTIQRTASDITYEATVSTVYLPGDEMKGRIIGREGRNIRSLEASTGVNLIIDDTPEVVVISSFDPVRREIARLALEKLILDGRIHPGRIENVVSKVEKELSRKMLEDGEMAAFDLKIHGISNELIKLLGRLRYRFSYGQNVLQHSREVANIGGMIAAELGANIELTKRGGLLHDIGKAITTEGEGAHATIGADIARKYGEKKEVVNIIASHHGETEPKTVESIIIQAADAISASRPGARRESIENYIKRLENLEKIANEFEGVEKSYAIQAGREIRVLVKNDAVSDEETRVMAREIASKIEASLKYPGQVKVTVIRETRIVEYAK